MRNTIWGFALFILMAFSLPSAAEKKRFYIYGDPPLGTKFKKKLMSSSLPFNKSYSELTERQKKIVKSVYEGIPENDSPPFPKNGRGVIFEPLVKGYQYILRDGALLAIAMVSERGRVEKVEIYKTPSTKLAEFVNTILFNTEFDPGICNGKPCKMEYMLDIDLTTSPDL